MVRTYRPHLSSARSAATVHGVSALESLVEATRDQAPIYLLRSAREDIAEVLKAIDEAIATETSLNPKEAA